MLGSTELIVIVLIIFILFGAKSLPKFEVSWRSLRKSFKKALRKQTRVIQKIIRPKTSYISKVKILI